MLNSCECCGVKYSKRPNISYAAWSKSRFCSRNCMQKINPGARSSIGKRPWNYGLKSSNETRKKISESQLGRKRSLESIEKQRSAMIGRKITWADKISASHKGKVGLRGKDHPNWQGGKTKYLKRLRNSTAYKNWREAVFKRDDYTCQVCGIRGAYIEADHIKPFAYFPNLRFNISNGRTLCKPCHIDTDTYSKGAKKYA